MILGDIQEPICSIRGCRHLIGVIGTEMKGQYPVCAAFPDGRGIPEEILDGTNDHSAPLPKQKNAIVFEKGEE
jgi:hypothetical protein